MKKIISCVGYYQEKPFTPQLLDEIVELIENEKIKRPEIEIDLNDSKSGVSNLHLGLLIPLDFESHKKLWCLTIRLNNKLFCYSKSQSREFDWYLYCGAETEVVNSCILDYELLRSIVLDVCKDGVIDLKDWVPIREAQNL